MPDDRPSDARPVAGNTGVGRPGRRVPPRAHALARPAADASARRSTDRPPPPTPTGPSTHCTGLAGPVEVAQQLHNVRRFTEAA
ncbi:hypothetical protein ACFU5O_34235 [Streptomyces sp. NPDC057445]|uniref:hypothetical protein n=1 Tax=Streptomyces sp. NPDC057445 TaxID=3346136 RepID=UPI0036C6D21C